MATAVRALEPTVEESVSALVDQTVANPVAVFTDERKFSDFYARLKEETDRHVPDLSTATGRKAIASLAFRVTKAKTALDKAGLGLTEDWRNQIALVNASRKKMVAELDELAAEVRRPLTEWEEAEKVRIEACLGVIEKLRQAAVVTIDDTSATVRERGMDVYATTISTDLYGDLFDEATTARQQAITVLKEAMVRLKEQEAQAAELERLRAAEAERLAREQEERQVREAEELARREAEEARERERAEKARIAEAERLAAERAAEAAREKEARKAREEQERRDAEHAEALAAERARAEEAERLARAERDRTAEIERRRIEQEDAARAEAERAAEEQRAREANKQHRAKIKTAAKQAIMTCGVSEEAAQKVVLAIIAGEVPAVRLEF